MKLSSNKSDTLRSLPLREGGGRVSGGRLFIYISQGEHQQQDFKYKVSDAVKLARSVSAFANTDGGRLLIGVRDDGRIHGVQSEEEVYMMEAAANRYCSPESVIHFESIQAEGHTVVIATIPSATHRPVCALEPDDTPQPNHIAIGGNTYKTTAYVRVADQNIVASPVHLSFWRQQQQSFGTTLHFTDAEHRLLAILHDEPAFTLNRLTRLARLPRKRVSDLLARFVRYGVVEMDYTDGAWRFALCP